MPPQSTSGASNSLYLLLKFLVDQASQRRAEQAVTSIGAKGVKPMERYQRAVAATTRELENLAKEIAKIEDPQAREAYTGRFDQLRVAINQTLQSSGKTARMLSGAYAGGAAQVRDMVTEVKVLNAQTEEQIRLEREFEKGGFREAFRWGITGFALTMAGQTIRRMGDQMFSPITKFTEVASRSDPMFRKWEMSTKKLELSFVRIGRVMLREVLPVIEKVAALAENAAAFVESHPGAAKAIVGLAATMAIGGRILVGIGQLLSVIAASKSLSFLAASTVGGGAIESTGLGTTLKFLGGASIAAKIKESFGSLFAWLSKIKALGVGGIFAAIATKLQAFGAVLTGWITKIAAIGAQVGKALLGIVSTLGGAIGGGILAGFGINELLAGTQFGQQMGARPIGQYATVAAYGAGKLLGGEDTGLQWARKVAEVFGYIEKETEGATDALEDFGNAFDLVAAEATELYSSFMEEEQAAKQKLATDIAKTEAEYEQRRIDAVSDYGERRADLEEQYEQKRTDIVQDYERDRSRMIEDYNRESSRKVAEYLRKVAREQEDFERETADDYAEFVRDQRDLQQDLQRKLADLERKYHEDVEDAREDHLKRLRKLEQDHAFRVDELVAQRDALGLVQEMRRYSLEKSQLEEEYRDRLEELRDNLIQQRQEIQEDYARRLQELREQFAIEQQRRREDFELKMQQMAEEQALEMARRAEDHQIELEQRQEQFKAQLEQLAEQNKQQQEELKKSYLKELQDLREAKAKQLMELRNAYENERRERATQLEYEMKELLAIEQVGYAEMEAAARAYVDALLAEADRLKDASGGGSSLSALGFASGGYAKGLVMTGEEGREFIMTNSATRAAEKIVGGKLTQANLLGAMMSSRKNTGVSRGSSQINVYQRVDFQGYLTAQERSQLRKMMRSDARQGVLEAIGAI